MKPGNIKYEKISVVSFSNVQVSEDKIREMKTTFYLLYTVKIINIIEKVKCYIFNYSFSSDCCGKYIFTKNRNDMFFRRAEF